VSWLRGRALAAAVGCLAAASLVATAASPASAAAHGPARTFSSPGSIGGFNDDVTFIGDSVTAGFGYCGIAENAAHVSCVPNEKMANSWYFGNNSLDDCAPPAAPTLPNDACSNDNDKGEPWNAGTWHAGSGSPVVAYPYQIAKSQSGSSRANVSDWAITGSTPADWDPKGGAYGPQLEKIKNQYVVMTLGANPLLSYFTDVKLLGFGTKGKCVDSTGYEKNGVWYSGTDSQVLDCVNSNWDSLRQTLHLENIYAKLLLQHDRVLVLGYYRGCSWSFGNWQPYGNIVKGPASGNSCRDEIRPVSPQDHSKMTQWDQSGVVASAVNSKIQSVVSHVQDWAKTEWPGTDRYKDLAWATPDQAAWSAHQPPAAGAWVILNDTWIHPDKAGAGSLARTVTEAMCSDWGHWCGSPPAWG
jgi:hypothetical protein